MFEHEQNLTRLRRHPAAPNHEDPAALLLGVGVVFLGVLALVAFGGPLLSALAVLIGFPIGATLLAFGMMIAADVERARRRYPPRDDR